jgi:hypothetical protein
VIPVEIEPASGDLTLTSAGISLDACQAKGPLVADPNSDKYCASFELPFGGALTKKLQNFQSPGRATGAPGGPSVHVDMGHNHWGYPVTESDPGYVYKPNELTLPSGAKLAVPKEMVFYRAPAHEIVASASGDRVVLVFNADVLECRTSQDIPGRYKMALVETATGRVTALGEGDGAGHARFRADGELFIQQGSRVYDVARDGTRTALPEGVLLVPPLEPDHGCGF